MAKPQLTDVKRILAEVESLRARQGKLKRTATHNFYLRFVDIHDLYDFNDKYQAWMEPKIYKIARANFIVNVISALEMYFKALITEYQNRWVDEGIKEMLQEKISLHDAFILCKNTGVEKADLIAIHSSFQNLSSIESIFRKLTGKKMFLDAIGFKMLVINKKGKSIPDNRKNFKKILNRTFELRHKIIHEGYIYPIDTSQIDNLVEVLLYLPSVIETYFDSLPVLQFVPELSEFDEP